MGVESRFSSGDFRCVVGDYCVGLCLVSRFWKLGFGVWGRAVLESRGAVGWWDTAYRGR